MINMSMSITQILLVIISAVLFLAISVSWWVLNGNPQAIAMLNGIIPSLTQAEQLSLEQGFKTIHVKIKEEGLLNKELILNEFHPTNEGALGSKHLSRTIQGEHQYFFLNKFEADKCYIFTSVGLRNWVYRVSSGSVVSKNSEELLSGMLIENEGCDSYADCKDMKPGEFTVCGYSIIGCAGNDEEKLKGQEFTTSATDNCVADEEGCPYISGKRDCCTFAKVKSNQHVYEPAYNVVCGFEQGSNEARWHACTNNQYATVEANGVQFTCNNITGEWSVKSGSGIQILNPRLEYTDLGTFSESETYLEFTVADYFNEEIKDVKVSAKVADLENGVDCDWDTAYADSVEKTTASIAGNGGVFKYSHDNFCWKAKTFDVDVVNYRKSNPYDNRKSFYIECKNADPDKGDWQACNLAMPGEYKGISQGITNTLDMTCNSKNYNIQLTGPGTTYPYGDEYINTIIKENGATISNDQIYLSRTVAANNVKITIWEFDDSNAPSWKAKVWARCT